MKQTFSLLLIFFSLGAFCQNKADAIVGKWMKTPKETLSIEVFKSGDIYRGKIDWSNDAAKKPLGYLILDKMRYNKDKEVWEGGKIHDPSSGKSYSALVSIKDDGVLEVHGYIGMKFLGSKRYFKRVE